MPTLLASVVLLRTSFEACSSPYTPKPCGFGLVQNPARSQQIPIIKRKLAGTQLAAKLAMSLLMFEDMLLCPIMSHYQISECDGCLRNL